MVSVEEGQKRAKEIACACFHEISVRENIEQVCCVFKDAYRFWRVMNRYPKLKRSTSDVHDLHSDSDVEQILSPDRIIPLGTYEFNNDHRNLVSGSCRQRFLFGHMGQSYFYFRLPICRRGA